MLAAERCRIYSLEISDLIIHRQSAGEQLMWPCSPYSHHSSFHYWVVCQYWCTETSIYFMWSTTMYFWFFDPTCQTELPGPACGLLSTFSWAGWHGYWKECAWKVTAGKVPPGAVCFRSTPFSCHLVTLGADLTQGPTRPATLLNRFKETHEVWESAKGKKLTKEPSIFILSYTVMAWTMLETWPGGRFVVYSSDI